MQDSEGFNPYKFGFGAASDSHNTAVPYRQDNFFGGHSFTDGTIEARMSGTLVGGMFDARTEGTGGLTGVWAEENTRASIFEAMQRKETFAVSGPHIKVRFFGGWEYTADDAGGHATGSRPATRRACRWAAICRRPRARRRRSSSGR